MNVVVLTPVPLGAPVMVIIYVPSGVLFFVFIVTVDEHVGFGVHGFKLKVMVVLFGGLVG